MKEIRDFVLDGSIIRRLKRREFKQYVIIHITNFLIVYAPHRFAAWEGISVK